MNSLIFPSRFRSAIQGMMPVLLLLAVLGPACSRVAAQAIAAGSAVSNPVAVVPFQAGAIPLNQAATTALPNNRAYMNLVGTLGANVQFHRPAHSGRLVMDRSPSATWQKPDPRATMDQPRINAMLRSLRPIARITHRQKAVQESRQGEVMEPRQGGVIESLRVTSGELLEALEQEPENSEKAKQASGVLFEAGNINASAGSAGSAAERVVEDEVIRYEGVAWNRSTFHLREGATSRTRTAQSMVRRDGGEPSQPEDVLVQKYQKMSDAFEKETRAGLTQPELDELASVMEYFLLPEVSIPFRLRQQIVNTVTSLLEALERNPAGRDIERVRKIGQEILAKIKAEGNALIFVNAFSGLAAVAAGVLGILLPTPWGAASVALGAGLLVLSKWMLNRAGPGARFPGWMRYGGLASRFLGLGAIAFGIMSFIASFFTFTTIRGT